MWIRALALAAFGLPQIALAEMSAEEFEAYTTGKTLFFSLNGQDYGVERYKSDRRVEWSFLDGECTPGIWYEDSGYICFAYEGWAEEQCWIFEQTQSGLIATFSRTNQAGRQNQYFAYEKDEEMLCLGPETGV